MWVLIFPRYKEGVGCQHQRLYQLLSSLGWSTWRWLLKGRRMEDVEQWSRRYRPSAWGKSWWGSFCTSVADRKQEEVMNQELIINFKVYPMPYFFHMDPTPKVPPPPKKLLLSGGDQKAWICEGHFTLNHNSMWTIRSYQYILINMNFLPSCSHFNPLFLAILNIPSFCQFRYKEKHSFYKGELAQ